MICIQLRHPQCMRVLLTALSFCGLFAVCDVPASVDLTRLPLGDGHISNKPERGSVWACRPDRLGGRRSHGGPWIRRSDRTFDLTVKPMVEGAVSWPSQFTMTRVGEKRRIVGNGLPNHPTGTFPIGRSTEAYQYDHNPNSIRPQDIRLDLPAMPTVAASASCVPLGYIGILLTGGAFFNALDANGEDAVAHEMQDAYRGHPQSRGIYHYHSLTPCSQDEGTGHSSLVGYAFDGFGLYGYRGEEGRVLTNADLDACHGHTHEIVWDGERMSMYHYHATAEYPYTIGCYRGQPVRLPRAPR
jgi:YHYH protein